MKTDTIELSRAMEVGTSRAINLMVSISVRIAKPIIRVATHHHAILIAMTYIITVQATDEYSWLRNKAREYRHDFVTSALDWSHDLDTGDLALMDSKTQAALADSLRADARGSSKSKSR